MSITEILVIVFYFAIILVPLVLVIGQTFKDISRYQSEVPDKKEKGDKQHARTEKKQR